MQCYNEKYTSPHCYFCNFAGWVKGRASRFSDLLIYLKKYTMQYFRIHVIDETTKLKNEQEENFDYPLINLTI